jgi:hypothetical protein
MDKTTLTMNNNFIYKSGKKIITHELGHKMFIDLPLIVHMSAELRSYKGFDDPNNDVGICVELSILHGFTALGSHLRQEKVYFNNETETFFNKEGNPITITATNYNEMVDEIRRLLAKL